MFYVYMFFTCAAPTAAKITAVTRPGLLCGLALLNLIFDHSFIPRRNLEFRAEVNRQETIESWGYPPVKTA